MPADPEPAEVLELAAEFPASTRDEWRALAAAVVRRSGTQADPEDALASTTYDGIRIAALYTAADAPGGSPGVPGRPTFVRGAVAADAADAAAVGWEVRQQHADPDAARTNRAVLADLGGGVTSLWLVLGAAGLPVSELAAALDSVRLDAVPVALDAGGQARAAAETLLALAEQQGAQLTGSLGADPIGNRARTGAEADLDLLGVLAERGSAFPGLRVATVDATVYHDAGASDATELAVAASVGVAYLRALTAAGLSVDAALEVLEFRYAVTAEQFGSIAKLRAARRIWDRVAQLCDASAGRTGQRQHAVTSRVMLTRRDPWVNLLRTTIACFAAAIGGAEAITVVPFDAAIGIPDDFARRIARNTQAILHDESSLARVLDAAGGSWYVESLTDALAAKAWEQFTAIERCGGALAALEDGTISGLIASARDARAQAIAHRRAPITGVSEYALLAEAAVTRPEAPEPGNDGPLPARRYAAGYEALRDRSDADGQRPRIFLAALGPVAAHSARAGFAANLFAAGGIEAVVGTGDVEQLAAAFTASGASVACLCSSDEHYADCGERVARALRGAGATRLLLAGTAEVPGVAGHVFAGCDALGVLRSTLDAIGVPA
ncbi:MAG: methylmalonyl-CoA mutase family protein [Jatrophihabitans sp.]